MKALKKTSLFDFQHYKEYLLHWISAQPSGGGERSRLAEALKCQLAYVSQVLSGNAHFSLEQAEVLNILFDHTEDEAEYFLLLVQSDRAGSVALRTRLAKKIKKIADERLILRNRLQFEKVLKNEDQMTYYSAWYYAAIHVALAIPGLETKEALSKVFHLSPSKISKVLEFLITRGLVKEKNGIFSPGDIRMHLSNDSPMISKHHTNWRMKAIQSLEEEGANELHYSSVITISETDTQLVRETLIKAIERVREVVRPSKDELLYCYSVDLFSVLNERSYKAPVSPPAPKKSIL